jgi:hypothetical protein
VGPEHDSALASTIITSTLVWALSVADSPSRTGGGKARIIHPSQGSPHKQLAALPAALRLSFTLCCLQIEALFLGQLHILPGEASQTSFHNIYQASRDISTTDSCHDIEA